MARNNDDRVALVGTTVRPMTVVSRKHGALACLAVAAGIAVACGDSPSAAEESWVAKPPAQSAVSDAGARADADAEALPAEVPPGPLCVLTGPPVSTPGDVLVYSEDFDGNAVDPVKWNIGSGYRGHGAIANTSAPANAVVADGLLKIVSERNPSDTDHPYVSGLVDSLGKFARTYGRIEFRARFPYAAGVWYAIWGRPWSQSFPEIDIEIVNRPTKSNTELYFVNHWAAPPLPADDRRSYLMDDTLDLTVFRTYTLLWKPGLLEWQIDGVPRMQAKPQGIPNLPVYWIINGWVGGWPGSPTATTPFPNTFEVDYLHVYRVDGLVADPVIKIVNSRTKYAKTDTIEVALANFDEACAHVEMYDGESLVRTVSTRPLTLPLSRFTSGPHTITFVATDGVRRTTSTLDMQIN
jgi:beta-glucanase (GH16 family)